MSEKSSTFAPAFQNESWTESYGARENFNFWREREYGENSYQLHVTNRIEP